MFTYEELGFYREELKKLLEWKGREWGVSMTVGQRVLCSRNSHSNLLFTVELAQYDERKRPMDDLRQQFLNHGSRFGLTENDLYQEIEFDGKHCTIIGWNCDAPETPVVVQDGEGKRYSLSTADVLRAMGKQIIINFPGEIPIPDKYDQIIEDKEEESEPGKGNNPL